MWQQGAERTGLGRRACCVGALVSALGIARSWAAGTPVVRLGILQFGTVQWLAEIILRHGLDNAHGIALEPVKLANNDAGRIALLANAADIVVSDWFFVASQRGAGIPLSFAPFSSATGAIMVPAQSPIATIGDLQNRRLGIAGGPLDKSWLLVRAAARQSVGRDLAAGDVVYGAPPLLSAKLQQGELDAVLTFWNFAARLKAAGFHQLVSVADCAHALGLSDRLSLIGFVFHEEWAQRNLATLEGFLAAAADAEAKLMHSDEAWQEIRPLMDAPDDTVYQTLRRDFGVGLSQSAPEAQQASAARLFEIVRGTGGARATGGLDRLPAGTFWHPSE